MVKPALKLEPSFKSGLERTVANQLEAEGLSYEHEKHKFTYNVPSKDHKYTPDFKLGDIFIETKGGFGYGPTRFSGGNPAEQRQKLILVKQQNPGLDLRIVFQRASTKIYKGSPTTYAKWATDNNIPYADKGVVPQEWIEEMHQQQNGSSTK